MDGKMLNLIGTQVWSLESYALMRKGKFIMRFHHLEEIQISSKTSSSFAPKPQPQTSFL